jgi:hypothetical protein
MGVTVSRVHTATPCLRGVSAKGANLLTGRGGLPSVRKRTACVHQGENPEGLDLNYKR